MKFQQEPILKTWTSDSELNIEILAAIILHLLFFSPLLTLNEAGFITLTQSGRMETEISTAHKQTVDNTQILCSMYSRCDKS